MGEPSGPKNRGAWRWPRACASPSDRPLAESHHLPGAIDAKGADNEARRDFGGQLVRRQTRSAGRAGASGCGADRRNWGLGAKTAASFASTFCAGGIGVGVTGAGVASARGGAGTARGCGLEAEAELNADRLLPQHIVISLLVLLLVRFGGPAAEPFQQARPS
jgi:hypothetical protein